MKLFNKVSKTSVLFSKSSQPRFKLGGKLSRYPNPNIMDHHEQVKKAYISPLEKSKRESGETY